MAPAEDPGAGSAPEQPVSGAGPARHSARHAAVAAAMAVAVLGADQATKWWAQRELDERTIDVVWTLQLRLVTNRGASFSLGRDLGPLIGVTALVVVVALAWAGRRVASLPVAAGLGLVIGGALGNLTDRAFRSGDGFMGGAVIDFIDLQWWPVFNVADAAVVVGAGLLLLTGFREPPERG